MSVGSSQCKVWQRIEETQAASLAKMENRKAIPERNVLRADVMVTPLDYIADIIWDNHWGYLYNCACTVYPRLVREFYGYLKVIQNENHGIILQTSVQGHVISVECCTFKPLNLYMLIS
jgi:hypothetical protein